MILDHSFPKEKEYVQKNNIPLVICGGTVEYHGPHCSYGCDTLVAEGLVKKLMEKKNMPLCRMLQGFIFFKKKGGYA